MNKYYLGVLLIILSTLGFSVMPIFAVYAYTGGISVSTLLFLRFLIAAIILSVYIFFKYKKPTVSKRDLVFLFILGGVFYTLQSTCYFTSLKFISPSLTAFLLYTYPIIVSVLSFFIEKERITLKLVVSMALSFVGIFTFLRAAAYEIDIRGILLALTAAFIYSCYILLGNKVVKQLNSMVVTTFVSTFASVGLLLLGIARGEFSFDFQAFVWLPIMGLTLFSTILAIFSFFSGMELLGPTKSSILSMLEPVFTATLSLILFHELLEPIQLLGGIAVLVGAGLAVVSKSKEIRSA